MSAGDEHDSPAVMGGLTATAAFLVLGAVCLARAAAGWTFRVLGRLAL